MQQPRQAPEAPAGGPAAGTTQGTVADAPPGNWVDRLAPAATRPYLRLSRADRPIGTWLLLIPCFWAVALAALADPEGYRPLDLWLVIGSSVGAFLMRGAGCTWNDITDREFDAAVARTRSRPIPSGQVSAKAAAVWMVVQALVASLILFSFNGTAILLGVASLALVCIYPFAKRFTWWPQAFLGLAFNWGALLLWAAHTGSLGWAPVALYASGIAWTLFYDTIYAHQDKEDDALIGVRSTARLFGQHTGKWLVAFMMAATLLMTLAVLLAVLPQGSILQLLIALAGVWGFGAHMTWQIARLDTEDTARCLRLFRSNRDAGLIPALFLATAALL
ncbi:4-hydroxybenzoate polyprenyltransferase [[Luteovulum] sphaeroides subsp. megalophilum]|uniref:4-hydroxybenzoate octaprenyltransferase n=1 Tax=Cereibacter sphaeroides TaxID=1063 RepID=UPI000B6DFEF1|nr:4-hydroxybenzoate octaprenyltransferase [Cereibacter sphaeroides]SNS61479.1 4-hydroxybenzoate polyprenyltransferase [[Luteovulum] sphaeroides subsp. megalophilum]